MPTRETRGSDRPLIREIEIEGFKSIERLKLELGRVTVLIGENGCGKSNILEAIAFASAAYADRLSNEFLASRGIRSTELHLMRPAFSEGSAPQMRVQVQVDDGRSLEFLFVEDASSIVPAWSANLRIHGVDGTVGDLDAALRALVTLGEANSEEPSPEEPSPKAPSPEAPSPEAPSLMARAAFELLIPGLRKRLFGLVAKQMVDFVVFSPENSALRTFAGEGQILPGGIKGEGLFAYLRALQRAGGANVLEELNRRLGLMDWFSGFEIPGDLGSGERRLSIRDRYLPSDLWLDQRSANEGFLFLLFYYTLLLSPDAPRFFAIDNIDASLNPRLCARLMKDVVELAKERDKQVVVTTHNPAVLDGLSLADDEQRLVVISRTQRGTTRARRVPASRPIEGAPSQRLSEAFIRGFLGGLPDNF